MSFRNRIAAAEEIAGNDRAAALLDGFPLSPGHCLVIPRRHVSDFFALTQPEQADIGSFTGGRGERVARGLNK